ncbi:uncharacterized protein LOC114535023 [Dendronephthya gigantea]|uniref:uncharacterized protein LOC114535023 n=1 Tax=Dendronephthya gigantea TaxID=151771 RepID=UPI001069A97C|nr:uncharacterized protein LOC114535023 [Dendronephthya gigantea]
MASNELEENANFIRLSKLLVDKGTEALRNTFDAIHPAVSLPRVLAANKTSLQKLKPRVINNSQWDLLFPPSGNPPDSKTFDITLLTVLFRNICGFPSTGWDVMPPDTDRSTQANITRIKCYRNDVFAHVPSTRVHNSTFESLWKKIAQAIVELGVSQSDVDDLKKCPLGPEEEVYVQKLKDWKLHEDECIKMLATMTQIVEETRDGVNLLCQFLLKKSENEIPQTSLKGTLSIPEDANTEKEFCKESGEDVLRKLAKHNFKSKIRRKVKFFLPGTREWLLKEVDEWFCSSDSDSRIKLITAGPGFGKSVFAAKICEDFEKNGKLAACHFCDFSDSNLRDPMVMLQSLASQMCKSVPGFKNELLDQLKRPHQVKNLRDGFRIYLQNPLDQLEIKEQRLVVIDGLDESAADNKNEITHLIAEYFPDLPEKIKILVTSRPEISVADLRLRDDQKTNIANVNANNNSDLELYFKECLPSLVGREVNQSEVTRDLYENPYLQFFLQNKTICLLSIFVAKCQGSFLYAYHFQSGLKARYDLEKITNNDVMEFLPEGLHSVYERYFKRLEDELSDIKHEKFDVFKILEMLPASEKYLPLTFVAQAFGLAPDCRETKDIINKINDAVSCLLYVSDDMLTVFHKSVIDWLLAKGYKDHQYTVKVDDGHRSLWLLCEKIFEEIEDVPARSGLELYFTNDVEYALKHGLKHLEKCKIEEGKILKKAELALLRERIAWTRKQLSGVDDNIATLTEELWLTFEEKHFAVAKRMIDASFTRTFNKARSTQIAKYTRLTSERSKDKRRQEDLAVDTLRRTVVNQSARKLMPVEEEVLALGLNFAVVPHKIPKEEIVQHLEPKLNHLRDDIASNIRVKVTEVLRRTTLPKSNLSKEQKDAVRNLRADKSIHILKADKGNATVLLNRAEYESKIHALLETPTYKELKRDPTANIERKVCSKLSELRKSGICLKTFMII